MDAGGDCQLGSCADCVKCVLIKTKSFLSGSELARGWVLKGLSRKSGVVSSGFERFETFNCGLNSDGPRWLAQTRLNFTSC